MSSFSVFTRLGAKDKASKIFKKVGRTGSNAFSKIGRAVKKVNRGVSGMVKNFGLAGKIGGTLLAGFSFAAIAGQISDTIQVGVQFEKTMVGAAAKFPGMIKKGTEQFELLEAVAKRVGSETEFSASEAAEGLNFLALAGFSAEQAIAAVPGTIDLATAATLDLGQATDIATDSLGAFNLMSEDSVQLQKNLARVSDVLAKTSTTANTDISQMFEAIRSGGPVANAAGVQIEQFGAAVGVLANAGIKAEKAGTVLKNVFLKLQAPAAAGRKELKRLGITVADQNGNMKDFTVILDELNDKLPQGVKRATALNNIFGKIPIAGVNVLLAEGGQKLRDYTAELQNSEGFAKKLAATMRDNTEGNLKSMSSAIEGLKIQLFEAFAPAFNVAIKAITGFVMALAKGFEKLGPFGPMLLEVVIALTAAAAIIAVVVGSVVAFSAAWGILNSIFLASPIGWIVLGIAALIFIIIQLVKHFDKIKAIAVQVFKILGKGFLFLLGPIGQVLLAIGIVKKVLQKIGLIDDKNIEVNAKVTVDDEEIDKKVTATNPAVAASNANTSTLQETSETIEKSQAEVTIKDETGCASVTKQTGSPGSFKLDLPPAWSF